MSPGHAPDLVAAHGAEVPHRAPDDVRVARILRELDGDALASIAPAIADAALEVERLELR